MPVMSAMRKATTPITGGMICPPVEAAASTAPAKAGLETHFLMMGMVKTPVETTLATAVPDREPNRAEAATAAWAGPPAKRPVAAMAMRNSTAPAPDCCNTAPKHDEHQHGAADHLHRPAEDAVGGEPQVFHRVLPTHPRAAQDGGRQQQIGRRQEPPLPAWGCRNSGSSGS